MAYQHANPVYEHFFDRISLEPNRYLQMFHAAECASATCGKSKMEKSCRGAHHNTMLVRHDGHARDWNRIRCRSEDLRDAAT